MNVELKTNLKKMSRKFDYFSKTMALSLEELDALSEIIGKYLQEKNRLAFQKDKKEDKADFT